MNTIPEDVRDKIIEQFNGSNAGEIKMAAALFGYTLSLSEIDRLKKVIDGLQVKLNKAVLENIEKRKEDRWRPRCEAAEYFVEQFEKQIDFGPIASEEQMKAYRNWQNNYFAE